MHSDSEGRRSGEGLAGKRIVVHFGAHKTASSALQMSMRTAAQKRPETAYFGPANIRREDGPLYGLRRLGKVSSHIAQTAEIESKAVDYLRGRPETHIILSEENFLGQMPGRETGLYARAGRFLPFLSRLVEEGADVRGLLFVREQASLLQSSFLFRVPTGESAWADAFLSRVDVRKLSWLKVATTLQSVLGDRLFVIPYEALRSDYEGVRRAMAEVDPMLGELQRLSAVNVPLARMPLFVLQFMRTVGLELYGKAFTTTGRAMQEALRSVWKPNTPVDSQAARAVLSFVGSRLGSSERDWRPEAEAALALYRFFGVAQVDPMLASERSVARIRSACRDDNQRFFEEFVPEQWHSLWDLK